MTKRTSSDACATLTSKGLHKRLIRFAEKSSQEQEHFNVIMERRIVAQMDTIIRRFQRLSSLRTFGFTLESKVLISDVGLYPLHAHDINCNANSLTPNQIKFCLVDTKQY